MRPSRSVRPFPRLAARDLLDDAPRWARFVVLRFRALVSPLTLSILVLSLLALVACGPGGSDEGVTAEQGQEARLVPEWQAGTVEGDSMYFSSIISLDFDPSGHVYALDLRAQNITKLDADGEVVTVFAGEGQGPGELAGSRDLAWFDGRVLVANNNNGRIEVFDDSGEAREPVTLEAVNQPSYVFPWDGDLWIGRQFVPEGHFLYRFDADWSLQGAYKEVGPTDDRLDFLRSHHLVCPSSDGVWLVYLLLDKIEKVNREGEVVLELSRDLDWDFPVDPESGEVIPEILVTRVCAVDPDGNLHVVYSNPEDWKRGNDLYRFGPDGTFHGKVTTLPIHRATAIAFDDAGAFYYSDGITLYKARLEAAGG